MGAKVSEPDKFRLAAAKLRGTNCWSSPAIAGMFRFEMGAVRRSETRPERLWWDLVEESIKRSNGRKGATSRTTPQVPSHWRAAYYHKLHAGEMFASQVHHALSEGRAAPASNRAGPIYVGNKAAGQFMKRRGSSPG